MKILVVVIIIGVGVFLAKDQIKPTIQTPNLPLESVQSWSGDAKQQVQVLGTKASNIGHNIHDFWFQNVTKNDDKPVHSRAIEYGTYLYCKQVVADYEEHLSRSVDLEDKGALEVDSEE